MISALSASLALVCIWVYDGPKITCSADLRSYDENGNCDA